MEYLTYGYLKGPRISKNQHKRITRQSQEYFIEEGKLKKIFPNGDIKICIAGREIDEHLKDLHITDSGEHLSIELMWHLVTFGPYWWPTCGADIKNLCNHKCLTCNNQPEYSKGKQNQSHLGKKEFQGTPTTDWRRPYMEYLTCEKIFTQDLTPEDKRAVEHSHKYFVFTNGTLQRIRKGGKDNQRCIPEAHVPMYLARIHGETEPHLAAMETWKAVATGEYWWPTWGVDVCNYLKDCKTCKGMGTQPAKIQDSVAQEPTHAPDWRLLVIQQLANIEKLNHIDTQEELGLTSFDTETYFVTKDGLKYRLPNGVVKMCITKEDAIDWVKRIYGYQIPPLPKEEIFTEIHKGPYWWPNIPRDVEYTIDECKRYQDTLLPGFKIENYGTILRNQKARDWREPIIQHLKNPMELSNFAFHEELGVSREELPQYFLQEGKLKRKLTNGDIKLCISKDKGIKWLETIHHQGNPHLSMDEMISQANTGPYWWPTIPPDIDYLCRNCKICWPEQTTGRMVGCTTITAKRENEQDWRTPYIDYLKHGRLTTEASTTQRQQIAIRSRPFMLNQNGTLIKEGPDGMRRTCVAGPVTTAIIAEAHEGIAGGHFSARITLHKILTALYWWPTMKRDVHLYCTQCDICQRVGPKISTNLQPLHPTMPTEVFQKWGLDFIGPVNPPAKGTKNRYIITATDYTTKWVEARALKDNTAKSTAKFLFEEIITKFGCPLEFVSDQGSHFINDTIKVLTQEFMILHRKSTTYYPQANGQAESTNKVIKVALTKMVNANRTDWDTKLHAALWAYRTAYKVTTKHTPFSLVFGTEALLPMAYLHPDVYQKRSQEIHPILEKRMEQLRIMDLTRHEAEENMRHMQTLRKERHDHPKSKTRCHQCKQRETKPPQNEAKKQDTLKRTLRKLWRRVKTLEATKMGSKILHPKHVFIPVNGSCGIYAIKYPGQASLKYDGQDLT